MNILVLTAFYPIPGKTHERMFVHIRNRYYQKCDISVTVLNFNAQENYSLDGINVITFNDFINCKVNEKYDILISHSANLRNHYKFIRKYGKNFKHLVFFFHGHEILYLNKDYPRPYSYVSGSKWYRRILQNAYDGFKIYVWAKYYQELAIKSDFIFVSEWIHQRFMRNTGLNDEKLNNRVHIINNSIGTIFEENSYDPYSPKEFDFITIRSNLDGSKYCTDLLLEFAKKNPENSFLLIGKGDFFKYYDKPNNLKWINETLNHEEMISYLNKSKCALMLTREDTQGVMTCEMESFGIPTITSNLDVCREFFEGLSGVSLISNDTSLTNINEVANCMRRHLPYQKDMRFGATNTIQKEVDLLYQIRRGVRNEYSTV